MKQHTITLTAITLAAAATLGGASAEATPAFSRQINADCKACHFQNMHALNKFGRAFKENAFHESEKMRAERMHQARRNTREKK